MAPSKKSATTSKATPSFTILQEEPAQSASVAETSEAAVASEAVACASETVASECTTLVTSGRVKWFNNKAGYGFITVNDCETNEERDMFVHHSEIKVDQTQYKYLVQGEYVEFVIGSIARDDKIDV
jgi:cold shock CspA family protein